MLRIQTNNPHQLIERINHAISEGKNSSWGVDKDGDYFITITEWKGKAWMRPKFSDTEPQILRFGILEPKSEKLTKATYAIFHCRFAEMLLALFDTSIDSLDISPMLDSDYDIYAHT